VNCHTSMEYSGEGVGVYAEAKGEYTRQLCQFLGPALQKFFLNLLDTAKEREPEPRKLLLSFQTLLEGISEWNIDKVQRETQSLAMSTQCDYMEELLTAVFVAHTKVLSAIRLTNKQRKLQITIPKLDHFLHKTLIECARLLWTNTFLFTPSGSSMERQKNMRQIEALLMDGILQGVRVMLPVKSILREYLSTEDTDTEAEETEDEDDEEEDEGEEEDTGAKSVEEDTKPLEIAAGPIVEEKRMITESPTTPVIIKAPQNIPTSDFDPSQFDIYSDVVGKQPMATSKSSKLTSPVTASLVEIPTIYLEEPTHVKFSNVDTEFSDTNINDTKLSQKNEIIGEMIDTDMFDFEEL